MSGGGPDASKVGVFIKDIQNGKDRHVLTLADEDICVWTADSQGFMYTHRVEWLGEVRRRTSQYVDTERIRRVTIRFRTLDGQDVELLGADQEILHIQSLISV